MQAEAIYIPGNLQSRQGELSDVGTHLMHFDCYRSGSRSFNVTDSVMMFLGL